MIYFVKCCFTKFNLLSIEIDKTLCSPQSFATIFMFFLFLKYFYCCIHIINTVLLKLFQFYFRLVHT